MKNIIALVLSFIFTQQTILARDITSAEIKQSIQNFKIEADQKLALIRDELTAKRYPQAHFIKSIQLQLNDLEFTSSADFRAADEILNNLVKGISSQSSIYKDDKKVVVDNNIVPLGSLKKLRKEFIQFKLQGKTGNAKDKVKENELSEIETISSMAFVSYQKVFSKIQEVGLYRLLLVGLTFFMVYSFFVKDNSYKAKKIVMKKSSQSKPNETQTLSTSKSLTSHLSLPVCLIDKKGNVIEENPTFLKNFGKQKHWNTFIENHFKVDETFQGTPKPHTYLRNQNQNYFISISSNKNDGSKLMLMQKVEKLPNALARKKVVKDTNAATESFSTLDLLENSIARMNSFRSGAPIAINEKVINEKVGLMLNQETTQRFFDHYLRILNEISKLKSTKGEIAVSFKREDNKFSLSAIIPNATLVKEDLVKVVLSAGRKTSLQEGLNDFNKLLGNVKTKVSLKNVSTTTNRGISIQVLIDDESQALLSERRQSPSASV